MRLASIETLQKAPRDPRTLYHWLLRQCHGYMYMPKEAIRWREHCMNEIRRQAGKISMTGRLQCRLDLYPPTLNADFDNYNKPLFDALEHSGLFENDRQIRACLIVMRNIVPGGMVKIQLESLGA